MDGGSKGNMNRDGETHANGKLTKSGCNKLKGESGRERGTPTGYVLSSTRATVISHPQVFGHPLSMQLGDLTHGAAWPTSGRRENIEPVTAEHAGTSVQLKQTHLAPLLLSIRPLSSHQQQSTPGNGGRLQRLLFSGCFRVGDRQAQGPTLVSVNTGSFPCRAQVLPYRERLGPSGSVHQARRR